MNKVFLIIQREYLTRVRKRAFIIMTLLVPTLLAGMFGTIAYLASNKDNTLHIVNVIDKSGKFIGKFPDSKSVLFRYSAKPLDSVKASLNDDNDMVLFIPQNPKVNPELYAKKKNTLALSDDIQQKMNDIVSGDSLVKMGIDTARLHRVKSNIVIQTKEMTAEGDKSTSIGSAYALAFAGAILIYMSLFIYGAQVMRGVIEEKTSRIIEVIVSSVKPFQLMAGKIIGVGLVGLTQFALWIILSYLASKIFGQNAMQSGRMQFIQTMAQSATYELLCFGFYWLTGFLLYSALFAAVGSAVDSETETQQFMFPITLPLLFTYILSVSYLFQAPDSPLAQWLSIIPFTAPVAMMVRIPFHVPGWQLGLSMGLMIIAFLFTTYVASRIYRVGILMYGKKTSFKEIAKWFFYKE